MLVLSRKEGESVMIDGHISVTVIRLAGGRVRLGIEAPKEVSILRSELPQWPVASIGTTACEEGGEFACATPAAANVIG